MNYTKALNKIIEYAELNRFTKIEHHIVMNPIDIAIVFDEQSKYHPKINGPVVYTFNGWVVKPSALCPIGTIYTNYNSKDIASPNLCTSIDNWQ